MGRPALTNDVIDLRCKNLPVVRVGDYKNRLTKIQFKCKNCDNTWLTTFASIIVSKKCCPLCSGVQLNQEIINSRIEPKKLRLVSGYVNTASMAKFECLQCRKVWNDTVRNILACQVCPFHGERRKDNDIIDFKLKNRTVKRIGNYVGNFTKIDFQCKICNIIWATQPCTILNQKSNCPACYGNKLFNNEIIDKKLIGRSIKRIGEYSNSRTHLLFRCEKEGCGREWEAQPVSIICNYTGCPECNTPGVNEKLLSTLLLSNNFKFFHNHKINKIAVNEKKLFAVDFYFPDIKLIIEYNGLQHYKATGFGPMTKQEAEAKFIQQKNRDSYVDVFCKTNNIKIIWVDGRKYYSAKLQAFVDSYLVPLIRNLNESK